MGLLRPRVISFDSPHGTSNLNLPLMSKRFTFLSLKALPGAKAVAGKADAGLGSVITHFPCRGGEVGGRSGC